MLKLIPILFLVPLLAHGQSPNFFLEGSRWLYQSAESWEPGQQFSSGSLEQYQIQGDTTIGGILYQKIYSRINYSTTVFPPFPQQPITTETQAQFGPSFIRLDALQNKVYYRPAVDSTERIIYDFNLQVGDAMPMQSNIFSGLVVDSIENGALFGVPVKKFYTTDYGGTYSENYILEGMGGSNGLTYFQPVIQVVSGGIFSTNLVCFQSGDSIYAPLNGECPFLETVSTKDADKSVPNVVISPNPTSGAFSVVLGEASQDARFKITDCWGRIIQTGLWTGQTIHGRLPAPGLYFWYLEKAGRMVRTGKLLCR